MPQRYFSYPCCSGRSGSSTCSTHGAVGRFEYWGLRLNELMYRYMVIYGVAAMGPHRSLVDKHLEPFRKTCTRCDGRGLEGGVDDPAPTWCSECGGAGGFWTCSPEEVRRKQAYILAIFPDAEVVHEGRVIGPKNGLKIVV